MKPYILYQLLEQLIATPNCTVSSLAKKLALSEKTVRTYLKHTEPLLSDLHYRSCASRAVESHCPEAEKTR